MPQGLSETFVGNALAASSPPAALASARGAWAGRGGATKGGKGGRGSGASSREGSANQSAAFVSRLEYLAWVPACVAWRGVVGCDPVASLRRPSRDQPCDDVIPDGLAGFCECGGGRAVVTLTCSHQPLTCLKARVGGRWAGVIANTRFLCAPFYSVVTLTCSHQSPTCLKASGRAGGRGSLPARSALLCAPFCVRTAPAPDAPRGAREGRGTFGGCFTRWERERGAPKGLPTEPCQPLLSD